MADIFISYKREDRDVAQRLSTALEHLGFDVWWDFELLSGDQFRHAIEKVIDECSATIVLWSQLSRSSSFVVDEATYAKEQNKLCPTRIDDCRLPLGFGGDHVIDLRDWHGELEHEGLQSLLRSVEAKTGKKARLGGRVRERNDAGHAEVEAFKTALAAESASALQAFLQAYPQGVFSEFVRRQMKSARASGAPPNPQPTVASQTAGLARQTKLPWSFLAGAATLAFIVVIGFAVLPALQGPNLQTTFEDAARMRAPAEESSPPEAASLGEGPMEEVGENIVPSQSGNAQARRDEVEPYGLSQLNGRVRAEVERARAAETGARAAAQRARTAANRASAAAERARSGEAGYGDDTSLAFLITGDTSYLGALSSAGRPHGYGVAQRGTGSYSGEWRNAERSGFGVSEAEAHIADRTPGHRYEGEWANGFLSGLGVFEQPNEFTYAGEHGRNSLTGVGVLTLANGQRYEGAVEDSKRDGLGVLWNRQGRVVSQGQWTDDVLTTALSP